MTGILPYQRQDSTLSFAAGATSIGLPHAQQYVRERGAVDTRKTAESINGEEMRELLLRVIRKVFPRHTAEYLARLRGVPVRTAQSALQKRLPNCGRRALGEALLRELDREILAHIELRVRLEGALRNAVEMAGPAGGRDKLGDLLDATAGGIETAAARFAAAARWLAERAASE